MRRILSALLLLLVCAVGARAAAPTFSAVDGVYEWERDTAIDTDGAFDTLAGTSDSSTIIDSIWRPDKGYEYILVRDAITGTGSDSVKVQVRVDCFDGLTKMYALAIDSFTASTAEAVHIPIGGTLYGNKFRIRAVAYADNGGQVILNRLAIWRRRAVTITQKW